MNKNLGEKKISPDDPAHLIWLPRLYDASFFAEENA